MIVCLTPPQMNDFCDLLGTPDAPVSKIASVKILKKYIFFYRPSLAQNSEADEIEPKT